VALLYKKEKDKAILEQLLMKKNILLALFFIFVLGFALRTLYLPHLALTFLYDQARDVYIIQQILSGDIKILGPPTSTPGLYHGVFYYYLLAPSYWIGNGSPIIAAYWIALFNAATVFIVFYLTYLLTKKGFPALLAAFLFAISFEATQYATWLSNPTIGVWTVPLIYLGLWAWIKEKKKWGVIVTALGLGLSIQAEIFLVYHIVPVVLWLWVSRKKLQRKQVITFLLFLFASLSTMILAEVKFGFKSLSGLKQLALAQEASLAYVKSLGDYLVLYLNQIGRIFALNSYPGNIGYGSVFVLVLVVLALIQLKKSREISWGPFLASWLLSHLTVVTVGGTSTPFLMVGIGPAVSIIMAIFLYNWWKKGYKFVTVFILLILIFGNLGMIAGENPKGSTLFAIQKDMLLSKQLKAIDYTYEEAEGEPFSVNSLTSPLWINTVWAYLYKWYGLSEYGYLPEWHGRDQVGQLGSLPPTKETTELYYLILEPMEGIPQRYLPEAIAEEDIVSTLIDEKYFGELRVQKRTKRDVNE
jgi:hypothetical protein